MNEWLVMNQVRSSFLKSLHTIWLHFATSRILTSILSSFAPSVVTHKIKSKRQISAFNFTLFLKPSLFKCLEIVLSVKCSTDRLLKMLKCHHSQGPKLGPHKYRGNRTNTPAWRWKLITLTVAKGKGGCMANKPEAQRQMYAPKKIIQICRKRSDY